MYVLYEYISLEIIERVSICEWQDFNPKHKLKSQLKIENMPEINPE
jgi:hypothetical protein